MKYQHLDSHHPKFHQVRDFYGIIQSVRHTHIVFLLIGLVDRIPGTLHSVSPGKDCDDLRRRKGRSSGMKTPWGM